MVDITNYLQENIRNLMDSFESMQRESEGIESAYFDTDASTLVPGLTNDTDAATLENKLTKANYVDGITFCQNLNKFFTNQAVTQSDYLQTINKVRYADADTPAKLSEATEEIGKRIKQICLDALTIYNEARDLVDIYFDNEIGDIVSALDSQRIIPGSDMTQSDLSGAITMLQEFMDLIGNAAVTTGDYSATIARWARLKGSITE